MMTSGDDLFQQAMNAGHSAAWDGSWDRAAGFYRQALELSPNHPRALSGLALALYELQDYENSLRTYLQAARLTPEDPLLVDKISHLYERLGIVDRAMAAAMQAAELYLKSHDTEKASDDWNRVLRLNPDHLQARMRLALVYERLGRPKEAAAEYTNLAALFQRSGNPEKAAHAIQHALQLFPGSEEAQRAMQLLQSGRSLPSPARPSGRKAPPLTVQVGNLETVQEEEDPSLDPVAEARGHALTMLASLLFDVVSEDSQPQASRRGLGAIVRNVGGSPARGSDPNRMMLHLSQVVDLQTCGQDSQALEELERAREAGLDHPAADYDLGLLLGSGPLRERCVVCRAP
jgi:tetratricopeptide (TPR) repeat protein